MTKINITWEKNTQGKFDFKVEQNNLVLFKKCYTASEKYETAWKDQATLFGAFTQFLQDQVDTELAVNSNFKWKSFSDFKKWAGAKMQHEFFNHESEHMPKK